VLFPRSVLAARPDIDGRRPPAPCGASAHPPASSCGSNADKLRPASTARLAALSTAAGAAAQPGALHNSPGLAGGRGAGHMLSSAPECRADSAMRAERGSAGGVECGGVN